MLFTAISIIDVCSATNIISRRFLLDLVCQPAGGE